MAASVAVVNPLARFREDPAAIFPGADPWQAAALRSTAPRMMWLTCRQAGKSTTAGHLAAKEAILRPGSTTLLVSPSLRQSGELFRRAMAAFDACGRPVAVVAQSALRAEFGNGSRIVSLPGSESTIRGYTANLVILDEAARIPDSLLAAVRPMLATTGGRLLALSTAWARAGFFYDAWTGSETWERTRVTAAECPRITANFLEQERRALGDRVYAAEYLCQFMAADSVFDPLDIAAALRDDVEPLFTGGPR